MKKHLMRVLFVILLLSLTGCEQAVPPSAVSQEAAVTETVRAIWIPYMETAQLVAQEDPRKAIADCMEDCASRGADTVYFHVRANSDAYYDSAVYPPTSDTALCLQKGIDPLATAVEEAHARGMALHAWINPYRIGMDADCAVTEERFFYNERWYYIPTADSTHALVLDGVREIVSGYAVDGIQFDDYFYPVGAVAQDIPAAFEEAMYAQYREAGGTMTVADWRRAAVDRLMAAVYAVCHSRAGCVFGVSPAGDPAQVHEEMYADVARWMAVAGYIDYVCPQLYFGFAHETAPFEKELARWSALPSHRGLTKIAGLAFYKTGMPVDEYAGSGQTEWASGGDIVARQVRVACAAGWQGSALYSHLSFTAADGRDKAIVSEEIAAVQEVWKEE